METASPTERVWQRKDGFGVVIECSDSVTELLGWAPSELIGDRTLAFLHPSDHERALAGWLEMLTDPVRPRPTALRHRRPDNSYAEVVFVNHNRLELDGTVLCEIHLLDDYTAAHGPGAAVASWRAPAADDVATDGRANESDGGSPDRPSSVVVSTASSIILELDRAHDRVLHALTDSLPSGVVYTNAVGRILHRNARASRLLGADDATQLSELFVNVADADRVVVQAAVDALLGERANADLQVEVARAGLARSRRFAVNLRAVVDTFGLMTGALVCFDDVTESTRLREELEWHASTDPLTGCLNRRAILRQLESVLDAGDAVAVVFLDVNGLKQINDVHGHVAGDRLLAEVAGRLRRAIRGRDHVGRIGGDEFLVVCPTVATLRAARLVADRAITAVAGTVDLGLHRIEPTLSVGVVVSAAAVSGHGGDGDGGGRPDADRLIAAADAAMYAAKRSRSRHPIIVEAPHGGFGDSTAPGTPRT